MFSNSRTLLSALTIVLSATGVFAQDAVTSVVIGGQPTPAMLDSLKKAGFDAVLSTRGLDEIDWDEAAVVDSLGMTFVSIPMSKPIDDISHDQLAAFDAFMTASEKPFLHCGSGNRVSALWAAWLVEYHGLSIDEALARAEAVGLQPGMRSVVQAHLAQHEANID